MTVMIISFVVVLVLIVLSGTMSARHRQKTTEDYLVASQSVSPWLSALSAVATNNSGFMFVGMIGFTFRQGFQSIWLMLGWILGDMLIWIFVHPKVRRLSEKSHLTTISELIGDRKNGSNRPLVVLSGIITFIFLGVYAAAQLKAGSTALHAMLDWDMWVGVMIGTVIVILYSFAGGIRADIWTDAAQSLVMFIAMIMLVIVGQMEIGSPGGLYENLRQQDPQLVKFFPQDMAFGLAAYVISFMFAGIGVMGQPHIMVRMMSIRSPGDVKRAGIYYFLWYIPFFVLSIGVGLYARALIPDLPEQPVAQGMDEPTEMALPLLTMDLLPQVFVGIALAGLFAATVSTADSQLIVCSGALTREITTTWKESYLASKLGTATITTISVLIALFAPEGVFGLVVIAWSAMGATLGSVLFLRVYQIPCSTVTAFAMMLIPIPVVALWHISPYNDDLFKLFPGMLSAMLVLAVAKGLNWARIAWQQRR